VFGQLPPSLGENRRCTQPRKRQRQRNEENQHPGNRQHQAFIGDVPAWKRHRLHPMGVPQVHNPCHSELSPELGGSASPQTGEGPFNSHDDVSRVNMEVDQAQEFGHSSADHFANYPPPAIDGSQCLALVPYRPPRKAMMYPDIQMASNQSIAFNNRPLQESLPGHGYNVDSSPRIVGSFLTNSEAGVPLLETENPPQSVNGFHTNTHCRRKRARDGVEIHAGERKKLRETDIEIISWE